MRGKWQGRSAGVGYSKKPAMGGGGRSAPRRGGGGGACTGTTIVGELYVGRDDRKYQSLDPRRAGNDYKAAAVARQQRKGIARPHQQKKGGLASEKTRIDHYAVLEHTKTKANSAARRLFHGFQIHPEVTS